MSHSRSYFKEVQEFRWSWVWLVILIAQVLTFSLFYFIASEDTLKSMEMSRIALAVTGIFLAVVFLLTYFLFRKMRLEVEINDQEIRIKFPPFKNKCMLIHPQEILSFKVRIYKPIKEFGGWGYRQQIKKNGAMAFNVSGNKGLELFLSSGKSLMIGTQRMDAIDFAMRKLMENK